MKKLAVLLVIAIIAVSCNSSGDKKSGSSNVQLAAAGATFPMPFYNLAFKKYGELHGTQITYGAIGSGGGIRSLKDKVVDFGASDAFLSDTELSEIDSEVIHIPTCLGAVVVAYNLSGVENLNLTPEILEGIFMGTITKWNDSAISAANEGEALPDMNITVVYRSDGSGTTFIFSDYMSKISERWASELGAAKSINWPVGIGAKGNPGVAGTISQSEGTIGYIGSEYAFAQKISYASLRNASGNYVKPSLASVSAAASGDIPEDTRVMITNSTAPDAYPISGFTWILLYKEQSYNKRTADQAAATIELLNWMLSPDAQTIAESVHYASLPEDAKSKAMNLIKTVTFNGEIISK